MSLKSFRRAAPALVLGLSAAFAVHAADATDAVSPAKKALVAKMLQLQQPGIEGIGRALVEQPIAPLMQQVTGLIQNRIPADKRDALAKDIQGDLKKYGESTGPMLRDRAIALAPSTIGTIMEQKFSEDELKQLIAWLDSPLARKYQQVLPDFQKSLTDKVIADTRPTIEPRLKELNETITRKLTTAAGVSAPAAKP
ncbi:MAG: DUF2059 domain-containing protein [Leptothrix sp. (in: b-proteobacteria)]